MLYVVVDKKQKHECYEWHVPCVRNAKAHQKQPPTGDSTAQSAFTLNSAVQRLELYVSFLLMWGEVVQA